MQVNQVRKQGETLAKKAADKAINKAKNEILAGKPKNPAMKTAENTINSVTKTEAQKIALTAKPAIETARDKIQKATATAIEEVLAKTFRSIPQPRVGSFGVLGKTFNNASNNIRRMDNQLKQQKP